MGAHHIEIPETFHQSYTREDRDAVIEIISWLNSGDWAQSHLARRSGVNAGTFNRILRGLYESPPGKILAQVLQTIRIEEERERIRLDIPRLVETRVYKLIAAAAHRARTLRKLACITASPGTGKTTALRAYGEGQPDVIIIDTLPGMHVVSLLEELVIATGSQSLVQRKRDSRLGTRDQMARALVRKLRGTNTLICIDEAESATPSMIEYFRKICDQARIGGLLVGDDQLFANLHNTTRQHDKTRSRFCMFPDTIKTLSREESDELARVYLSDHEKDLTPEVLQALWECSAGSARVLCDTLITSVRDFGLAQGHSLTPALIHQINHQVLNYSDRITLERTAKVAPARGREAAA